MWVMTTTYKGLVEAARNPSRFSFQKTHSDELLEGLLSKDYVVLDEREYVHLTLKGVKCLLDYEGYDSYGRRRV